MYRPHRTFRSPNTPEPEEGVVKKSEITKLALGIMACRTHYEVLQVPPGATTDQVRQAHRVLASIFHPDRPTGNHDVMARVNDAYSCLTDTTARRKYDAVNKTATTVCPTCKGKGTTMKQKGFKNKVPVPCATCAGSGHH
jgi:DnaJ-class molecular chaperone